MTTATASPSEGAAQAAPEAATQTAPEAASEAATKTAPEAARELVSKDANLGGFADRLDQIALDIGGLHVSLWDILVVLVVLSMAIVVAWATTKFAHRVLRRIARLDAAQQVLAEKLITIAVWVLVFLVGIDVLGIDLTALAVFSGALGLAVGFGLQKTLGNLIAGIILLMDRSIKPGDVISVTDQAGGESFGQIRKIGIRAISVVTRDKTEYLIPNENLMINQVVNWSYSSRDVRVKLPVGVSYGADMDLVEKLLAEAAGETARVLKKPQPKVLMTEFADSSVNFEIRFWIRDPENGVSNVQADVLRRVWDKFKSHDIEIPFPQRDINLRNNAQFEQLIAAIAQRLDRKDASASDA